MENQIGGERYVLTLELTSTFVLMDLDRVRRDVGLHAYYQLDYLLFIRIFVYHDSSHRCPL